MKRVVIEFLEDHAADEFVLLSRGHQPNSRVHLAVLDFTVVEVQRQEVRWVTEEVEPSSPLPT